MFLEVPLYMLQMDSQLDQQVIEMPVEYDSSDATSSYTRPFLSRAYYLHAYHDQLDPLVTKSADLAFHIHQR